MSEAAEQGAGALQERIAALRSEGAWRRDPMRFLALEALARRLPGQPPAVQDLLRRKLQAGVCDFMERIAAEPPPPAAQEGAQAASSALAQLNAYLRQATRAARPASQEGQDAGDDQLASARRFRQAWDRVATLDRVEQAVSRKPANAGPLNSHMLVLRTLDLMRELSPEYLRRFVGYAESLQWLEQARPAAPRAAAKAAGASAAVGGNRRKKK